MADNTPNLENEVAALIAAGFEKQDTTADYNQEGQEEKRYIDVDLYRLPNGGVLLLPNNQDAAAILDQHAIESDLLSPEQPQPAQEPKQEEPEPAGAVTPLQQQHRRVKPSYVLVP